MWVEENILHSPQVSRVLNEEFIYTEMWVERGSEGESVLNGLNIGTALPQYAVVDADGKLLLRYDRPTNVASMKPETFVEYLRQGKALFK